MEILRPPDDGTDTPSHTSKVRNVDFRHAHPAYGKGIPDHPRKPLSENKRFAAAIVLTGIVAGIVGWCCSQILHILQRIAWGLEHDSTLLEAASTVPWWHRVALLILAGVISGVSWTLLFRRSKSLTSVQQAVNGKHMPILRTTWHALTQIVIVSLGASIGREVAPREISSALSAWLSDHLGLDSEDRRIIVACGAGAGLAAVYSIPLSGAVYTLEILLVTLRARTVAPALAVSGIAVLVSSTWLRTEPFYTVPDLHATASLTVWAVLLGPVFGWLGVMFRRVVHMCEGERPRNTHLLWTLPVAFAIVGAVSVWMPSVLGNGQASAQTQFEGAWLAGAGLVTACLVLVGKTATTLLTIRAGGWGGTLTPGVALGAGLGTVTGLLWSQVWPGTSIAAFAFIGAAVFLGSSMKAPFTGLILVMEFTHQGSEILVPAVIAIGGAVAATAWAERSARPFASR
ncbi:chloride channel protein [Schaalia vaccimaxillae]|uniref:chloride channel protein n=1 Tax=Schaalia vaccimaxillae TaxID=183916 RepID=UPI0003B51C6D|nr:chloride channel protein [Schaalia vaccimaxillae]